MVHGIIIGLLVMLIIVTGRMLGYLQELTAKVNAIDKDLRE